MGETASVLVLTPWNFHVLVVCYECVEGFQMHYNWDALPEKLKLWLGFWERMGRGQYDNLLYQIAPEHTAPYMLNQPESINYVWMTGIKENCYVKISFKSPVTWSRLKVRSFCTIILPFILKRVFFCLPSNLSSVSSNHRLKTPLPLLLLA